MTKRPYWLMAVAIAAAAVVGATLATLTHETEGDRVAESSPASSSTPAVTAASPLLSPSAQPTSSAPEPTSSPSAKPEPSPQAQPERLTQNSKVTLTSIGPVQVGMTVAEASRAAGVPILSIGDQPTPGCEYVAPEGKSENVAFMVIDGRIARIDIWENSRITTRSGLGIGSTEAQINTLFPGQVEVTPHEYTDGHYVAFVPKDAADNNYRIVFETDAAGRVTQFRAGKLPEVMWVEGCL